MDGQGYLTKLKTYLDSIYKEAEQVVNQYESQEKSDGRTFAWNSLWEVTENDLFDFWISDFMGDNIEYLNEDGTDVGDDDE